MRQHDTGLPPGLDEMVRPNRIVLQVLGLWPDDRSDFARLRLRFFTVSLISLVVPQVYSIKFYWADVAYLAETGSLVLPFVLLLFKLLYITIHHREFIVVYERIKQLWQITDDPKERVHYEILARIGKVVTVIVIFACVANLISIVSAAVIVELKNQYRNNGTPHHRLLPVDLVYGFSHENTPVFECLFVSQSVSLFTGTILAIAGDGSVIVIILHIIGQFKLVNFRLRMIGRKLNDGYYYVPQKSNMEIEISRCIKHHQFVVSVADSVSDLISPMAFGQLITSGLQICISGYAVIEGSAKGVALIKCLVLFAAMIIQLMMWCIPGDILDRESGAVAMSVCHELPWAVLPASLQRDLLFVILRAQRTCKVKAFYQTTNIPKLTEVLKAAGSYMALLRSFKQ